jgi:phosphate transport system substrate-binding protein
MIKRLLSLIILICGASACQANTGSAPDTAVLPPLTGSVSADGSSTVGPITLTVAEQFSDSHPAVTFDIQISGTGGGFKRFCIGETDISDASRPIKASEAELCADNDIEYIELPVAFDGIAVVTNLENDFISCLTTGQLNDMWRLSAEATYSNWRDVSTTFPDRPLALFGPGLDSGTYDYFTEAINGEEGQSRMDFFGSEDDDELVDGVAASNEALGYFGYSYFDQNRDRLRLLAVDSGNGCVEPNTETISSGLYNPLSRPLFIYINKAHIAENPTLDAFVSFYLANAPKLVSDVGYSPLSDALYELAKSRYDDKRTGSVFPQTGSQVGISLTDLLIKEEQ